MRISGQEFTDEILEKVRAATDVAGMTRTKLSKIVCDLLNWYHSGGRPKDMNCRKALLQLERRGAIVLPPARSIDFTPKGSGIKRSWLSFTGELSDLGKLEVILVKDKDHSAVWREMMDEYHPQGGRALVGAQLRYLIKANDGWVGGLSFSASAWWLKPRDAWLGWDDRARSKELRKIICNSRFLVLPTVQVPNLASHMLGLVLSRIALDWKRHYGYKPALVETFVDSSRFKGTCYKAANFIHLGETKGRGRDDRKNESSLTHKQIYVYPLTADFRAELGICSSDTAKSSELDSLVDWAENEFSICNFGDRRLKERLLTIARDFGAQPTANIPQACRSRAKTKSAYRFMDNSETSFQTILAGHYRATEERIAAHAKSAEKPVVLCVQDTTTVHYADRPARQGLGPIAKTPEGAQGFILHSTLAFNETGVSLGVLDAQCWTRDPEETGQKARRKREKKPIEQKESIKWLRSYRAVADVSRRNNDGQFILIGDRESDLYELFQEALHVNPGGPQLLVRAQHNRHLKNEELALWEALYDQPLAGLRNIEVPRRKAQRLHEVALEIRFRKVTLSVPFDLARKTGGKDLPPIDCWAVLASEKDNDQQEAIEWLLLTTTPVESFEDAVQAVQRYGRRWGIEVFHKTLKSGCRIENRQMQTADRLETCLAIDMVVAWRIHHLTHLARQTPEAPCDLALEEDEWHALVIFSKKQRPDKPPTMREAVRTIGHLGGHLGRKKDAEPGTQAMWQGMERLSGMVVMYQAIRQNPEVLRVPQKHVSRKPRYG